MSDLFGDITRSWADRAGDRRSASRPVIEAGSRGLSAGDAHSAARAVTAVLAEAGVPAGALVIQLTRRRPDWPVIPAVLLASGRVWLPADITGLPEALRRSGAQWLITEEPGDVAAVQAVGGTEVASELPVDGRSWSLLALSRTAAGSVPLPAGAGYVIPTSGSTGAPKLVIGSRRGLEHFVRWEVTALGLGPDARVAQLTPATFDPVLRDIFAAFAPSAVLCVPEDPHAVLDAAALQAWLDDSRVTVLHCTPTLLRALRPLLGERALPALRHLLVAGEALFAGDIAPLAPVMAAGLSVRNLYGPTETTLAKLSYEVTIADLAAAPQTRLPVGQPITGASAIALAPDMSPCVEGDVGEIYIRTPDRSCGYLDSPQEQSWRFVPNPFSTDPEDVVFRTGDLGYERPGAGFVLVGRNDRRTKVRGVTVDLGQVEAVLRQAPGVADAAVRAWQGPANHTVIAGYAAGTSSLDAGQLRSFLRSQLSGPAVPAFLTGMDKLPHTSSGKLDYGSLPSPWAAPAPEPADAEHLDAIEQAVLAAFAGILTDTAGVGPDDDLLDIGGQSIEAARIAVRLTSEFGEPVSIRDLLEHGTPRSTAGHLLRGFLARMPQPAWAELIGAHDRRTAHILSAEPDRRGPGLAPHPQLRHTAAAHMLQDLQRSRGRPAQARRSPRFPAPLSFAQDRFWAMHAQAPRAPQLHYTWARRLHGTVHPELLERALRELVERHDSLRMAFRLSAGQPVQAADIGAPLQLTAGDTGVRAAADPFGAAVSGLVPWASRPFELGSDLPIRACFIPVGEAGGVLALAGHVIVSDGDTKTILLRELATLYAHLAAGQGADLEPPRTTFADFARWERGQAAELLDAHTAYWRERLGDLPGRPPLPFDRPERGRPVVTDGHTTAVPVTAGHARLLRATARDWGVSSAAITGAALLCALWRWSGEPDQAFQFPVPNRPRPEFEQVIGCFTESAVLRDRVDPGEPFRDLARRTGQRFAEAIDHAVPYAALMTALYPDSDFRDPALSPVMFAPQPAVSRQFRLPGTTGEDARADLGTSVWPLQLYLYDTGEEMTLQFSSGTNAFSAGSVRRLAGCHARILELIAGNPGLAAGRACEEAAALTEDRP
jgi:non-ribosomal peptide synthetase component F